MYFPPEPNLLKKDAFKYLFSLEMHFDNYKIEIAKGLNRCENIFNYRYPKMEIGTFF